jgi:hypothetical protein
LSFANVDQPKEVNIMLADVLRHVKEGQAYEKLQGQLQSIVQKILSHFQDLGNVLAMVDIILESVNFKGQFRALVNAFFWQVVFVIVLIVPRRNANRN